MAAPRILPDQAYLQVCFLYDEKTGRLIWRQRPVEHFVNKRSAKIWNTRYAATEAGRLSRTTTGVYLIVCLDYKKYRVSRIIFKLINGRDPYHLIDHKNVEGNDNKLLNLREATKAQNSMNTKLRSDNTSGFKGVVWDGPRQKFKAQIQFNSKNYLLGRFKTKEEAANAYRQAAQSLFGEFARTS